MAAIILIAGCGKKISSPSSSDPTKPATKIVKQQIVIKIASDKTLLVADTPCLQNELVARITQLVTNQSAEVVIRANNADDDQVKAIADACKKAGVRVIHYALIRF